MDSGASSHFCNDRTLFDTLTPTDRKVTVAAGKSIPVLGTGNVALCIPQPDGSVQSMHLSDVLYVPDFLGNLLSVKRLVAFGTMPEFSTTGCNLVASDGTVKARALLSPAGLYRFTARAERDTATVAAVAAVASVAPVNNVDWHARFGHADVRAILRLFEGDTATTANRNKAIAALKIAAASAAHCEACLRGKQPREALTGSVDGATRATRPLALVHIDLCGPFPTASRSGARYLCVIVDDYTRLIWARAINTKDAALDAFQYYRTHAEKFHSARRPQAASHAK